MQLLRSLAVDILNVKQPKEIILFFPRRWQISPITTQIWHLFLFNATYLHCNSRPRILSNAKVIFIARTLRNTPLRLLFLSSLCMCKKEHNVMAKRGSANPEIARPAGMYSSQSASLSPASGRVLAARMCAGSGLMQRHCSVTHNCFSNTLCKTLLIMSSSKLHFPTRAN